MAETAIQASGSSFRPSSTTYFGVLAWLRDEQRFHEECLLIPSDDFRGLAYREDPYGHLKFDWRPLSKKEHRLDPYRQPLSNLHALITSRLSVTS